MLTIRLDVVNRDLTTKWSGTSSFQPTIRLFHLQSRRDRPARSSFLTMAYAARTPSIFKHVF
jgi:hypothetical protein